MLSTRIVIVARGLGVVAALVLALASSAGCGRVVASAATAGAPRSKSSPAPLPERLADTGLYADFAAGVVAADVLPFVPQYPLWSDGATKRRWIRLPAGSAIDASDPDAWVFPIGTQLWKEFSFGRRIETRYLTLGADGAWSFASYVWSEDGRDARLAPERGVRGLCESRPGARFDIPSRMDCLACHDGGRSKVLGFSALQLSADRDPLAPHAEPLVPGAVDLAQLVERGLVRNLPNALARNAPRIAAATPRERAVLGYLHANCSQCHNASGPLASLGLDFAVRVASKPGALPAAIATTLGQKSRFRSACKPASERIVAGDPEQSVVALRLGSRNPVAQMPPLGTHVVDEQALDLIVGWIREDLGPALAGPTRNEVTTRNQSSDQPWQPRQPRNKE